MKKRKWIWFGIWLLSLVGISCVGGAVSYGCFWALTLLPVISLVYLLCVYFRFRIYQEVESRDMVCGQAYNYYFTLRNEDYFGFAGVNVRLFPDFSHVENLPEDIEYELLPGDEFIYRTKITCKYRGEYEIGLKEVVVTDFFRLFRLCYRFPGTIRAIVRPKLVDLKEIKELSDVVISLQREALFSKSEPDIVVRDYIRGDSLKKIHWKATAREGQLKVRTDTGEEKQGIRMVFDTQRYSSDMHEYLPLESKILEAVLALGMFFAARDMVTTVYYGQNGVRQHEITNIKSFEEFYGGMSNVSFREEEETNALFQVLNGQGAFADAKVLIMVLHELDDAIMQTAEQLSAEGVYVVIYVITDKNMEAYVRESTVRKKIVVIPTEAELEGVL
ncbi:MAG: DUF58 domain-containing protein [Lachnospiraceae bacterium]|nr:DUF58 domain-containing protein [Lachnospiraceae bacterium]